MEAKDTYIMESKNKLMVLTCHDDLSRELWVDALISEQAEISYKVGIKEVTDDMKLAVTTGTADIVDLIIKYEAKLKEWHIETD